MCFKPDSKTKKFLRDAGSATIYRDGVAVVVYRNVEVDGQSIHLRMLHLFPADIRFCASACVNGEYVDADVQSVTVSPRRILHGVDYVDVSLPGAITNRHGEAKSRIYLSDPDGGYSDIVWYGEPDQWNEYASTPYGSASLEDAVAGESTVIRHNSDGKW